MVKSPLVRVLLCLAVLALIAVTALALGTKQNFVTIDGGRKAIATKGRPWSRRRTRCRTRV